MPAGMAVRGGDELEQSYVVAAALFVYWPWTWASNMNRAAAVIAVAGVWSIARR